MINVEGKKIVLLGGAGFIGHNLALRLKAEGAKVEIIDGLQVNNLLSFSSVDCNLENRDLYRRMIDERLTMLRKAGVPLHVQDLRDYHLLNVTLNKINPQIFIHLAAVAHAGKSNKDPFSTFDHSLRTLENTLDAARERAEHFIYFSSSMVYGHFDGGVVDEKTICEPLGIYGSLKYAGEKLVIAYNQVFDLPYTIVRPSALYGERCVSRRVIQIFIENALSGRDVEIHGDGSDALDFTYVDDLSSGILDVVTHENSRNEIFNLTYGHGRTIGEVGEMLKTYFPSLNVKYLPKDNLMPDRGTLKIDKAKEMIGYSPCNPLEKGLEKYVSWYKKFVG